MLMMDQKKNKEIRRIQELCETRGISIYRLSRMSDIPNTTLTNMIKKDTMPTIPTIEKICGAFDITLSQFFASEDIYGDLLTLEQKYVLEIWESLDDRSRELAKVYMKALSDKNS